MIISLKGTVRFKLPKILKAFILIGLLVCCSIYASGQGCNCPPVNTCATCAGGLTGLTLQFNGTGTSTITASDQQGVVFTGDVSPGGTFSFTGSQPNEKFAGPNVEVRVTGSPEDDATIPTNCGGGSFVGSVFGVFTIVAGESKNGGPLCCSAATMDKVKPVISNRLKNMSVNLPQTGGCSMPVTWTPPKASDNCSVESFGSVPPLGAIFKPGRTKVLYTATDPFGNFDTCSFVVTVSDTIKPVISNRPGALTVSAKGTCKPAVTWTPPTATDNCKVTMTSNRKPGDLFKIGTTPVTYTAVDSSGNKRIHTFNVTVVDSEDPVITNCPMEVIVFADDNCEAVATWTPPKASDNCSVVLTSTHDSGFKFPFGEKTVVYTAKDSVGNTTTCSFKVIVKNKDNPVITGCPSDITVEASESGAAVVTWDEPVATAFCGNVAVTRSHDPGYAFSGGENTVTYKFTDDSGNTSTCSFKVIVGNTEIIFSVSPVITPDGNGINDIWELQHIERFPDNTVTVVDRWGNTVYSASGYDNETVFWNGTGLNGGKVPTGTYFYTIDARFQESTVHKKGFLEVIQ